MTKKKFSTKKISPESRELAKIETNLRHIYENPDGSLPDMKTFERDGGHNFFRMVPRVLFFVGCVAFGVVLWQGFIGPRWQFSNDNLTITLDGPATAAPGSEVLYTVRYRNPESTPLASAGLEMHYPKGFVFASSSQPELTSVGSRYNIGSIPAHSTGQLTITGSINQDYNATASMSVILSYKPSNFNALFEKVATLTTVLSEPVLDVVVTAPSSTTPLASMPMTLTIHPRKPFAKPISVAFDIPTHFTVVSTNPKPDQPGTSRWTFPNLIDTRTITIQGQFSAEATDPGMFTARIIGGQSGNNSFSYALANTSSTVNITRSPLAITMLVNGKKSGTSLAPGSVMNMSIKVQNTSDTPIDHGVVTLVLVAPSYERKSILQWSDLTDSSNGEVRGEQVDDTQRRGLITWTEKEHPALASVASGQSITFDVALPIKDGQETSLVNFTSNTITAFATLNASSLSNTVQTDTMAFPIHSDLDLTTNVESLNGQKKITWIITNSFHDLKDVLIETDLYGDFAWDENALSVPVGRVRFEPANKKLIWTIDQLPTNLDSSALQFSLRFNKNNPTQTELSSIIRVTATDTETNDGITISRGPMKMD